MDNKQTENFVNGLWDDEIIPQLEDYIRIPNKSPHFDPDWSKHGHMEKAAQQLESLVQDSADQRHDRGNRAYRRTHTGLVLRHSRRLRRRRIALRSLRQTARVQRLGRRPRALGTDDQGRQTVRARWRRRRLLDVRLSDCCSCTPGTGNSSRALRCHHRRLRGIRQLRPALLHRYARGPHRFPRSRRLPRRRVRQLRPVVVYDLAARQPDRFTSCGCPHGGRALGRRRRHRAVEFSGIAAVAEPDRG